jgi:hypothetical protein
VPWLALRPACAVRIDPAGDGPNKLVSTGATIAVTFSEPIDPTSVQPFDTLTVKPATSTSPLSQFVIGHIVLTSDATQFRFVPELPLHHETNVMERYLVDVVAGASGITDLAGNPLLLQLPQTDFTLDKAQPSALTSGIALRFASTDEDGDGKRELRGQFLFDLAQQQIVPRPVTRFSGAADASAPVVGAMIPLLQPVQTPLSPYGSKLHAVWRYHDVGLGLLDEATHNLDVEGMSWSPFAGAPVADHFTRFQMSFAHSKFLPDEEVGTSLLPNWPSSGLVTKFADNNYDVADPPAVVHAASKGYTVDPADVFTSPAGLPMTHWPLNRGVPLGQYSYWTWRDTAKIAVGGPNGHGADTQRLQQITKVANTNFYIAGRVPTIGLPLLTEFRTYPEFAANGTNGLRIAIALNSSASPYFRVFSTGGVTVGGQIINVDPDNTPVAMGAVNPSTGLFTAPRDNVFHYGEAEFVVRVSRAHTVWFDTASPSSFATPVVIAGTTAVPSGTQIQLAFRGASSITGSATPPAWRDAENYDAYGDGYNTLQLFSLGKPGNLAFTPSFFNNPPNTTDNSWKSSIAALDGARYVQARISFLSNAETSATTSLSSLGIAYQH